MSNMQLILLSFTASLGFGVMFHIVGLDLLFAGLGGMISRIALLTFMSMTDSRFLFTLGAATCAALYAELLAVTKKVPSTVYLYPTIIPLIPADLLYFLMRNLVTGEYDAAFTYAADTVYGITGLCLGFILASTVSFYIKKSQSGLGNMKSRLTEPMNKTVRSEK